MKHPPAPAARSFSSSLLTWRLFYGLGCFLSAICGFTFSRYLFLLLLSTPAPPSLLLPGLTDPAITPSPPPPPPPPSAHGSIVVRPWPHPDHVEFMRAHRILARVQEEQRLQYGPRVKSPRPFLIVTPTYRRALQAFHLTALMQCLMNLPYTITWLVVEAGGASNQTAALLSRSALPVLHLPFRWPMLHGSFGRDRIEARMRLHALRVIKIRRLDGIVVFADDSNVHDLELFHEAQKVKWMGSLSIGILAHYGNPLWRDNVKDNLPVPTQGPACNSSGRLSGWRNFFTLPSGNASAAVSGSSASSAPWKMEWAGFVMNSRLVWKTAKGKPNWVKDLDEIGRTYEEIDTPLDLLRDEAFIEPLGDCGKKVLLWWLRVEAEHGSKFPPGWVIDPPLQIPRLSEMPPELAMPTKKDQMKHFSRTGRSSRRAGKSKKKQEIQDTDKAL